MALEPDDRPDRWIMLRGDDEPFVVVGNPHTHRGRMSAQRASDGLYTRFSRGDVVDASPLAAAWIDGFLAGSEPEAGDLFGPSVYDEDLDSPRWERWRAALAEYRASGSWPYVSWSPPIPLPDGVELPPFVWTLIGDEVCRLAERAWEPMDPQPERHFLLLAGSECDADGHHRTDLVTDVHSLCERCGFVVEGIPSDMTVAEFDRVRYSYRAQPC